MADDAIQVPPNSTGSLLRTETVGEVDSTSGLETYRHQQIVRQSDGRGDLDSSNTAVISVLEQMLSELKNVSFLLQALTDISLD